VGDEPIKQLGPFTRMTSGVGTILPRKNRTSLACLFVFGCFFLVKDD
jgi:hypothetical protein